MNLTITTTAALFATALAAQASTISTVSITEEFVDFAGASGNLENDSAAPGDVTVNGTTFLSESVATQNADGTSAVRATAGGNGFVETTTSKAQFDQSETNNSGASRDYTLSYSLAAQEAELFPPIGNIFVARSLTAVAPVAPLSPLNPFETPGLPANLLDVTAASFQYDIFVNDILIFTARADAIMDGFGNTTIDPSVTGFTPSLTMGSFGSMIFSVGPIEDDIFLGTFADGETIDVTSILTARAYAEGQPLDGFIGGSVNVRSTDPIALSSVGRLSSVPTVTPNPSAVPLPAAGWMLIAGLGGLGALSRRRKS